MDYYERFSVKPDDKVQSSAVATTSNAKGGHNGTHSQRLSNRPRSALVAAHSATDFVGVCLMPPCTRTPVIVRLR
jgi:hypothetical protein